MHNLSKYIGKMVSIHLADEWPDGTTDVYGVVTRLEPPDDNDGSCDSLSIRGEKFRYCVFEDEIAEIEIVN